MDVIAHMLIPMYQGAIQAAHKMDHSTTAAAGLADFAAYWAIIKDKVTFKFKEKGKKPINATGVCNFMITGEGFDLGRL